MANIFENENTLKKQEKSKSKIFTNFGFLVGLIMGLIGSNKKGRFATSNIFENEKYIEKVGKKSKIKNFTNMGFLVDLIKGSDEKGHGIVTNKIGNGKYIEKERKKKK